MQKIGSSTNTADANGEFTDGDPQTQIPCTWVMAAWLNTLQRELVHLCEEAGITIDPNDDTQVYQAIAALLNTSVEGMVKTVNEQEPDEHGNVKLGTAADADIQTSKDDVTAGRVLVNGGALALRTVLAGAGRAITDFDGLPANSVSFGYSDATHSPGFTGSVLDFSGSSGRYNAQIATQYNGSGNRIAFRTHNGDAAGVWNPWFELFHTGHLQTAAETGAMPYFGTALNVDLNTLGAYSAAGVHYQPSNAGATTANHYPIAEAGSLVITPSAYGCQQEYTTFGDGVKFVRGLAGPWNGVNGPWNDWKEIPTLAVADARYQGKSQASLAKNGWRKTADGYIEQWGFISRTADSTHITFPIAFPHECLNIQLTLDWNGSFHDQNVYVQTPATTGFNYIAGSGEVRAYFRAIGH